jgi:hypothetical protein
MSQAKAVARCCAAYHALPLCESRDDGGDLWCQNRATYTHMSKNRGDDYLYVCGQHRCKHYCTKGIL